MTNIVTLDEARRHLRYPAADTQDDLALQTFIEAADDVMRKHCGNNVPQMYDEFYDGGDVSIFLFQTPVLSIESIQEGWGFANFELDYVQVNSTAASSNYAYSIDDADNGYITRRSAANVIIPFARGTNNIHIVYTAGRANIPSVIKLAALELIAHWWQGSQQRSAAQVSQYGYASVEEPSVRGPGSEYTTITAGVPWRIIEMIRPFAAPPIIG